MTTFYIMEVMVPEHKKAQFDRLMIENNFATRDKKQFRVTNLETWIKGEQERISP